MHGLQVLKDSHAEVKACVLLCCRLPASLSSELKREPRLRDVARRAAESSKGEPFMHVGSCGFDAPQPALIMTAESYEF